jgi:hypothetical protein
MSGPAQSGPSSAAGRLVARSRRAAVRARESPGAIPAVDVGEAHAPGPASRGRAGPAQPTASVQQVELPTVALAPVAPAQDASTEERAPAQRPAQTAEPAAARGESPLTALAAAPKPVTVQPADGPGGLPAWTIAAAPLPATPRPSAPSPGEASLPPDAPPAPGRRAGPAEQLQEQLRAAEPERAPLPPARAGEPTREELRPTPASPVLTASPSGPARRSQPSSPAPAAAGPPQVLIDRIEVITPPALPAPPDPFLSLAARRAGASRHERARWRG